tara:strand:+ start:262 stop:1083 length:822 start_codon:yes stop_codon:yes gene_type:complete
MTFIDIGANLTHESFKNDLDTALTNAKLAGVIHIIVTGTDLTSSIEANNLTKLNPAYLSSTVGFHPHAADNVKESDFKRAIELIELENVVAIGEAGLDYNRNYSSRKAQLKIFEQQLELATQIKLPLFLHQRDAHLDFYPLLAKYRHKIVGGVVHCFTASKEILDSYLDLDMHIGITGWICDERRGQDLQKIVHNIPDNRLLIETDSPYLLPRTIRPKPKSRRNEPKFLPEVANSVSEHSAKTPEEIATITTQNAITLFNLPIKDLTLNHPVD